MNDALNMKTRALVLGSGGLAGIAWEVGLLVGLAEAGVDVRNADLFVGTSAGSAVAAQLATDSTMDQLFQRQVDPELQAKELPISPDFGKILSDFNEIYEAGGDYSEILQRIGAMAIETPTVQEADRLAVIEARLPLHEWPEKRLEIVAVDAYTGKRVVFHRESGVDLVDAVTASTAVPCVWPPMTIRDHRYIDGAAYSYANADLAAGSGKVLILQPDLPPFPVVASLDEQMKQLRAGDSKVELVNPDQAMKDALAAFGGNALDPGVRLVAATVGREQGRREAERVAALWD